MFTLTRIMCNPAFALLCSLFLSQNTFASINDTIDASRVSGVAPLAVFFDATGTTSTATIRPFHELHYQWDFGDPNAGTWQYGNPNNTDKNKAYGPVAAHVFETPGVYTVSLTTKTLHGDTAHESVKITVQDPNTVFSGNNTVCFSTSGNFSGCPSGARHIKTSSSSNIKGYIAPGRRLLMRRGERWTGSNIRIYSDGPGIIGAFGTGNKPVFDNIGFDVAAGVPPVLGKPGTRDWRVMDIEFINTQARVFSSEGEFENLLLLRLEAHNTAQQFTMFPDSKLAYYNANKGQQHEPHDGVFVVDSSMIGAGSYAIGRRYAVLGCSWDGASFEHVNRIGYMGKGIISHNYYARPKSSMRHLIKMHAPNLSSTLFPSGTETREVIISDNHFHGTLESWSVSLGPQSGQSYANEHVVDVIVERNLFTAENGSPVTQLHTAGYNISVRNNIFNLSGGGSGAHAATASTRSSGQPRVFGFWFHNNNIYRSDSGGVEGVSSSASDTEIHNNIIYSPAGNSNLGCTNGSSGCLNNLVNINPLWTEPRNQDFSLQPGSPAINSGVTIPVFDDYISNFRPPGSSLDIGAYESNGGTPPPPTPPPTVNITASPVSITAGDSSTLSWDTTNTDICMAYEGWSGPKNTSGSQSVSPTTSTIYTLTCDGAGGSSTDSATVSVTPDANPPSTPVNLLSSNITLNSTDLSWDASSDDVGVTGYNVYKDGKLETTTTVTSATVNGLPPNMTYSFTVSAQDAAENESTHSSPLSITTLADPVDGELGGYYSNWNATDGYTIGSGLDIALTLIGDTSTVKDVVFQVWSYTHGVEAAYIVESPPYIYPHIKLNEVAPGSSKYVQALLRDGGNNIIHTVSHQTTFTLEEPPAYSVTIDNRISTSSDDVEEALTSGDLYFNSSDIELGDDLTNNGTQTVGLRFQSVNIPQGATIDAAYLEFVVDEAGSTATNVAIYAQATDNAPAFAANNKDITNRVLTSAVTAWDIPAWNTVGDIKQSPDVSAIVQEVVNRAGWSANNDLVFVISGTGQRTAESYDGVSSAAPLLHVEYSAGTVLIAPTAGFTVSMTDLTASFTDTSSDSDGSVITWSWDFGDGNISAAQNPSHIYSAAGSYTVALTVTDSDGATDAASQPVTVTVTAVNVAPTAGFSVNVTDLTAAFSDTSSDSDGSLASWAWDFGDGNTSKLQHPGYTYAAAGTYMVTLTVTDDDGATDAASQPITVTAANVAPVAGFSVNVTDLAAAFTDASSDSDGSLVSWAWDFGDGNTSTLQHPGYTYSAAGTYTATLTVTDDDGATDAASQPVTVEEQPVYSVTIDNRISTSSDDVEEALKIGKLYFNSSDIELGDDTTNNGTQTVGLRFQSVNIPQGATIDAAYLEFVVDEAGSTATNVAIYAQATDNAPAFAANNKDITNRVLTSAVTAWDIPAWNTVGDIKQSPDVSAIVQEVVNRAGWSANNDLVFVISGTGKRTAESYDGVSSAAPLLHVEYTASFTDTSSDSDGSAMILSYYLTRSR